MTTHVSIHADEELRVSIKTVEGVTWLTIKARNTEITLFAAPAELAEIARNLNEAVQAAT